MTVLPQISGSAGRPEVFKWASPCVAMCCRCFSLLGTSMVKTHQNTGTSSNGHSLWKVVGVWSSRICRWKSKCSDGDRKPRQTILFVGHGSLSSGALYRLVTCYPVTTDIFILFVHQAGREKIGALGFGQLKYINYLVVSNIFYFHPYLGKMIHLD